MEKRSLIAMIDLMQGLTESERAKLEALNEKEINKKYDMTFLKIEEEITELSYIPESERINNETYRFYKEQTVK